MNGSDQIVYRMNSVLFISYYLFFSFFKIAFDNAIQNVKMFLLSAERNLKKQKYLY